MGMKKNFVLDTNVILHDYKCIENFQENDIYLPIVVLEELDTTQEGLTHQEAGVRLLADKGGGLDPVRSFELSRINAAMNVGFEPYAPVVITVPDTPARRFRLEFDPSVAGKRLDNIELLSAPLVERYPEKKLAKMYQSPLP